MAIDMGNATGSISLDTSGVIDGVRQASQALGNMENAADASLDRLNSYARSLEDVLSGAYKDLAKSSEQVTAAQEAYNTVLEAGQAKAAAYAAAVTTAEQQQQAVHNQALQLQQQLVQAQANSNAQLERYIQLKNTEGVNQRSLQANYEKYQRDLAVEETIREQLIEIAHSELQAQNNVTKAKQQYANVVAKAYQDIADAQKQVTKAEEDAATLIATNASKQQQAIEKSAKAHMQAAREQLKLSEEEAKAAENAAKREEAARNRAAKEAARAAKEAEQATREAAKAEEEAVKDAADKQALAFAVAAKAVDEIVNSIKTLINNVVELSKEIVDIGADFETAMAQVAATSSMSANDVERNIQDYQDLTNAAKEAGLNTVYSASEAAKALNYLALAGYSVEDSIKYMPESLTLAAAGAMDLGTASDMVTDAISALGLDISETTTFIDKMAKTAQSSNTSIEQLGRATLTIGATATVLSGGVTELDTALGVLANNGIKAAQGGTALRQILVNLTGPSTQASELIEELGLKIYDAEGNMRHLNEIFGDLGEIMKDFSDKERMETITTLFDARQLRTANALIKDSGEVWDNLQQKIENAEGAAEKMAETMRSNLNGAVNIAKSNLDNLAITLYEGVHKNLTDLVKEAIPSLQKLNDVFASPEIQVRLQQMSEGIKNIALKLLDIAVEAAPKIISAISKVEANLKSLAIVIGTILAFNIAAHIQGIIKAMVALATFITTNPYAILAAAIAAVAVAFIQIQAEAKQAHEILVAQVQEENDLYAEQRKEIEGVVDEWNDFKETAGKVKNEAQDQADKVRALYENYRELERSGQDTTLAIEALADEIPELNNMLAEGKDSFADITKAVDEYCNSLIRAAELEAAKDTYIQAVKTRNEIKRSLDAQKQAMVESGEAAVKAREAYEDYWNNFDAHYAENAKIANEELERLQAEKEAKEKIYDENIIAYRDATTAYNEANQAVLDSQEDYNKAIKNELLEEGQIYASRDEALAAESEARARKSAESAEANAEANIKASEEELERILAGWDKLDDKIKRRDITEDQKWKIIGDWFEANPNWDKDNKDLLNQYDKYMSYQEKKEEERKKQAEKEAEERKTQSEKTAKAEKDRIKKQAAEEEKAKKEAAQKLKKEVSDDLSTIDWEKDFYEWDDETYLEKLQEHWDKYKDFYADNADEFTKIDRKIAETKKNINEQSAKDEADNLKKQVEQDKDRIEHEKRVYGWSEEEYNNALREHLKKFNDYYDEYADERQKIQWKIDESEAATERANAEAAQKEANSYFNTWTKGYDQLISNAQKAYDTLQKQRTQFQNNLLSSVEFFGTKTKQVWDKASHSYKTEQITGVVSTKDLKEQLKDIQNFDKTMTSLKNKRVSDDLLSEIWGMSPDKAMEFATALNKMSSGELQAFSNTYEDIRKETGAMTDKYYKEQEQKFVTEYVDPLTKYIEENSSQIKTHMADIGEDTIDGYINGLIAKKDETEGVMGKVMDEAITKAKDALGVASPSKEFFSIGEFTIEGFLNGIQSKVYQISNIFTSLGQKAGESFINSFKATWDNFINMLNTTGGLSVPTAMTTTMFGTPTVSGSQVMYTNNNTSYSGLTKADVVSAIHEAVPDGDIILTVNESQFGRIARSSLNLLAEQQGSLGLQV